jgi:hypothetical protein
MEACASAHPWARELIALGHEVKLMPPAYVKAYVKRGKTDAADTEAITGAVTRPTMRFVAVKSAETQAVLMTLIVDNVTYHARFSAVTTTCLRSEITLPKRSAPTMPPLPSWRSDPLAVVTEVYQGRFGADALPHLAGCTDPEFAALLLWDAVVRGVPLDRWTVMEACGTKEPPPEAA